MKTKSDDAFLIGPYVGDLQWEYFQFAPYIIYLKKEHSDKKIIVFTRSSRFDLYGQYVDILVPLKLIDDVKQNHYCHKNKSLTYTNYDMLIQMYMKQYKDKFNIIKHIYPDISMFYYKLKWQFSRSLMNYDFKPRRKNKKIIDKYLCSYDMLRDMDNTDIEIDHIKDIKDLKIQYIDDIDVNSSILGCLIESIKVCKCVISNMSSDVAKLALLLKTPVITINEEFTNDEICLLNPYNIPVIRASNTEEGVSIYENNF